LAYERTLIQIRERSFLDLLDLALVVVRSRPRVILLAALVGIAPFAALNAYLTYDPEFAFVYYLGLLAVEAPLAMAPLTVVLGGLMFGERPSAARVARTVFQALPALIVYQVIVRALLVVSVIFYPVVPAKLAFMDEVILLERGRVGAALKRCSTLTGNRGGDFFGQWLAEVAFGFLFVAAFWFGTGAITNALTTAELTWDEAGWGDLYGFRMQLAVWLAITFFAVARFLTYIDQRIRLEGWEVKLRLQAVGRALGEASRW
jgi:hypothetical protein